MEQVTNKKMKIIFDFDNTLFDSMQLKSMFRDIARVNGFSDAESRAFYSAARNDEDGIIAITLDRYLEEVRTRCISENKQIDEKATRAAVDKIKKNGVDLLLPGAKELLKFCCNQNFDYHLLSLGVRSWQMEKMRWVGIDKIFTDSNTVFTVKEAGGKVEALRELFGFDFTGKNTVLFNDRADESDELLEEFSDLVVFLRRDERDERSSGKVVNDLLKNYGDRVFIAGNLSELLNSFINYAH
ncbi:MAG: hypothetical protein A2538_02470 [Candidatus Magasanikbacteria bacterium RIFOXYD2_FULL_41_14]|uniref:Haloacid dehalogenase n=1 Tax=Candidatus Magasanikbacteria bacterium RIFOXYD2_FULL_41_14 TaxID=1798709 RepID=A0A1F6PC28_9BACT|nr:MAG: hypothetical protein A2538_02470 [Candidatus Magasanikbacteria bacterium RIFOXYD2_FULL_41_14]